ncbi:hypothetical protein EV645_6481 [Kribbella rubisoli]|uniref:Glycosyl hydrolase n=1 Tax=Kribbella rubisoli TaxID=3075929 RepID=A0A4Q7WQ41_9ACTN|nr:hypothetical protein [Kribbella rubisoli]RZU11319.1 hypothetical protein EV645_6481 [Kribbella rubisoli]
MTTSNEGLADRGLTIEQVRTLRQTRGLSSAGIQAIPESALARALRRLEYPDMPRARELFRRNQARDERGLFPTHALLGAARQLDSIRLRRAERAAVAGVPTGTTVAPQRLGMHPAPTAGLARPNWVSIGPGNIGGRTRSLVFHPQEPDTIWAASAGGGLWRTDDAGQTWQPVDDLMANLAVTSVAIDPTDPDVLYAGTGEGFFNVDAIRGAGLFRTVDGVTWSQLPATLGAPFATVNRIALNATGEVLLAAGTGGLSRSADAGRTAWTKVLTAQIADVKCHPTDPDKAVAGSLRGGTAWLTADGGQTWTEAEHDTPWEGRVELAYATADPEVVYASVDIRNGEIWRSTDGGASFTARTSLNADGDPASYLGDQGWYGNVIWAGDPEDSDLVVVGGVDLWRSTDGGDTVNEMSTWWSRESAHADQHAIASHPNFDGQSNSTVLFGNDGGVYRAPDIRTVGDDPDLPKVNGWQNLNNDYGVTQFYSGAVNSEGTIIGGAQDNGTLAFHPPNGADKWIEIFGGDGGFCAADPQDPDIFYGEYVFLNIHRNLDGATSDDTTGDRYISGQFWDAVNERWDFKPAPFTIADAKTQRAAFIAPFTLDPNDSDRMLAGGESLWRTNDVKAPNTPTSGPKWTRIKPPSASPGSPRPFNAISAISIAPGDSDRVWVGYEDGQVWHSDDGTDPAPLWQRVDGVGAAPLVTGRFCTQIALPAGQPDVVLATFGGYVANNVWRSDDGGTTWRSIGAGLPGAPVRAITVHPRRQDFLYLGTELGLFASDDGGTSWSATNEGPTSCSVEDLIWSDETLICVTHGRGMFTIDLSGV